MDLAQRAVSRYPELGATPVELRTEIDSYCKGIHSWPGRTQRIILEKLLEAGSLEKSMSYWQVPSSSRTGTSSGTASKYDRL